MGGRGSNSKIQNRTPLPQTQAKPQKPQPPQQQVKQQPPTDQNTPVTPTAVSNLSKMSDAQLAQLVRDSQRAVMPNFLSDVADQTQNFVYTAGINEKPLVLDDTSFAQFMADNGINQSQILTRSVNDITYTNKSGTAITLKANDIIDMMKYSRLNYIGGKVGGQAYGAGTYFDMTGGKNTGYGKTSVTAVLNPASARVITDTQLRVKAQQFAKTHPQFAKAAGAYNTRFHNNNMSIYALAMGYNVIKDSGSGYHNVIDRSALVYKRSDT